MRVLGPVVALGLLVGCVTPYSGTRLDMDISTGAGFDPQELIVPTPGKSPGEPGYFSHYELYGEFSNVGLVRLATFMIRPAVETDLPCIQFLPDRFCQTRVHECGPYINVERFARLEEILAVVSVPHARPVEDGDNPYGYDFVPGFDPMTWPDDLFLDPSLTDRTEKLARENLNQDEVEAFCANLPDGYYVGNPLQITFPMHGEIFGVVDGADPRTGIQLGGVTLFVDGKLHGLTALILFKEPDPSRLSDENADREDILPDPAAQPFLVARADRSLGQIREDAVRGVVTFVMQNPFGLAVLAQGTIFEDIDEDPIVF